jgi:hypothetical protein
MEALGGVELIISPDASLGNVQGIGFGNAVSW